MKATLHFCLVAALLCSQAAWAQGPVVTSSLVAKRVETIAGKAVLKPAEAGKPGDVIEYTGTYHNAGGKAVEKMVATIPVPTGTTFIAGSADPARAQASTDGARYEPIPLMRSVRQPDGTVRKEPVPLREYRFVRWEVGTLAAAADAVVRLRVQIDSEVTAAGARP